ncbi:MAG: alkane 1-monooxygenase [Cyclobacteriaceae bacterium]
MKSLVNKIQLSNSKYLLSLVPSVITLAGNLAGSYFTLANFFFTFVVLVIADMLAPSDKSQPHDLEDSLPDFILILAVIFHASAIASLFYGIHSGIIEGTFVWFAAVSTGLNSGLLGINSAHELIHRRKKIMQNLGIWNLFLVCYAHFYTEHRLVHHVKVGTAEDPATARYRESLYRFWLRTIPGQFISALRTDASRQKRKNHAAYGLHNFTLRATLLQVIFIVVVVFMFSPVIAAAYVVQSLVAILLLEYVNYIEHYGLVRSDGTIVGKEHSWQSDAITSRFTLFELTRHSDHHMLAYKPYHTLESHQESPELPFGYFGMFYIALMPPVFFKMMDKAMPKPEVHNA